MRFLLKAGIAPFPLVTCKVMASTVSLPYFVKAAACKFLAATTLFLPPAWHEAQLLLKILRLGIPPQEQADQM